MVIYPLQAWGVSRIYCSVHQYSWHVSHGASWRAKPTQFDYKLGRYVIRMLFLINFINLILLKYVIVYILQISDTAVCISCITAKFHQNPFSIFCMKMEETSLRNFHRYNNINCRRQLSVTDRRKSRVLCFLNEWPEWVSPTFRDKSLIESNSAGHRLGNYKISSRLVSLSAWSQKFSTNVFCQCWLMARRLGPLPQTLSTDSKSFREVFFSTRQNSKRWNL